MEKRNLTVSLPKDLVRKAKMLAVRKDRSLSDLLRETLEEKVREEGGYQRAKDRQVTLMEQGLDLGTKGKPVTGRDALHERR